MQTLTIDPILEKRLHQVAQLIGNTPLVALDRVYKNPKVQIFAKLEWQQLGGSVKARPAFNIIKQAILNGQLDQNRVLLDASSGNTGIAYGAVGAALGIKVALCLPENASKERKMILRAHGVDIIYTPATELTDGAQIKAKELHAQNPDLYFYADQYANENNWRAHYNHTAPEIVEQTQGKITHFVAGLGTSGTFMGTSRRLKEYNPAIEIVSLQPDSPMHGLEGWKHMETAIVPQFYDADLADKNQEVSTFEAYELIKEVAQKEGLLISPSAAANLAGAIALANTLEEGTIVTMFPDSADKYSEVLKQVFD
ncbi:PLP-dependent cysteine synthase family protein [uncultured Microscilla sp.]|uniref:PLP-dependent cysteine synthase family protein n=1 Tax=uncultured Microscilla sp. TaxID=432653 RepID=UPI00263740FD|nr:cysteine synthase family protein [uncultured Microscilla sp.]